MNSGELSMSSNNLQTCCRLLTPGSPAEEHGGRLSLRVTGWSEDKKPAKTRRRKSTSGYLISPVTSCSGFLHTLLFPFAVSLRLSIPSRENETTHQNNTEANRLQNPQLSADQPWPWGLCWPGFPTIPFHSLPLTSSLDCSKYIAAQATRLEKQFFPSRLFLTQFISLTSFPRWRHKQVNLHNAGINHCGIHLRDVMCLGYDVLLQREIPA